MLSREEFESIVNARWQVQHRGEWRPVTSMHIGPRHTDNPLQAGSAVIFTGDESPWMVIEVFPGEIIAREPGRAPIWLDWREIARHRKATGRAPQRR